MGIGVNRDLRSVQFGRLINRLRVTVNRDAAWNAQGRPL